MQARIAYGADDRAGRASAPGSKRSFDGKRFRHEAPRKPPAPAPVIKASRSPSGLMPVGDGPFEAEGADTVRRRAADAIEKNPIKQRPPEEVSELVSGPRGPDRLSGPAPTGINPDGRH